MAPVWGWLLSVGFCGNTFGSCLSAAEIGESGYFSDRIPRDGQRHGQQLQGPGGWPRIAGLPPLAHSPPGFSILLTQQRTLFLGPPSCMRVMGNSSAYLTPMHWSLCLSPVREPGQDRRGHLWGRVPGQEVRGGASSDQGRPGSHCGWDPVCNLPRPSLFCSPKHPHIPGEVGDPIQG